MNLINRTTATGVAAFSVIALTITVCAVVRAADDNLPAPAVVVGEECRITLRKIDREGEPLVELSRDGHAQTAYRFIVKTGDGELDVTPHRGEQLRVCTGDLEMLTNSIIVRSKPLELRITARME